jgi:hypothetical protein
VAGDSAPAILIGAGILFLAFWAFNRFIVFPGLELNPQAKAMLPILTLLNNLLPALGVLAILIGALLAFL